MQRRILVGLLAGLTSIGGAATLTATNAAAGAGGGTLTVNTEADGSDEDTSDGVCEVTDGAEDCSLRAALDTAQGVGGLWDISVPAGDYLLDDRLFYFNIEAVVTGAGVGETTVTVDTTEGVERHLDLSNDGTIDVTLTDMTFTGGLEVDGGSIRSQGDNDLTIRRMHFLDNAARGSGGAIAMLAPKGRVSDTLVIEDSTFAGNAAQFEGGAVHVNGGESAIVTNSTFTDNVAGAGGAVFVGSFDNDDPGEATLEHVTMAGNAATGFQGDGALTGGAIGVGAGGDLDLTATIVEDSTIGESLFSSPPDAGDPAANCDFAEGAGVTSGGFNVVDDDTCEVSETTDQPDTAANVQVLGDNGGPTFTMALLAASPAVDAAGATCGVPDDQRGVVRPQDGDADGTSGCDSGAFELAATPPPPPPPPPPTGGAQPVTATPRFTG